MGRPREDRGSQIDHLYVPWERLSPEEQQRAVREIRRHATTNVRCERLRFQRDGGEPVSIGRPALYLNLILFRTPAPWDRAWRLQDVRELCADLRVCHYGDAWERARRELLGEPPLPRDAATLRRHVTEARERWAVARREYQERSAISRRLGELPHCRPDRIEAGKALVRVIQARDEYWLAVMVARVAEWEADCALPSIRTPRSCADPGAASGAGWRVRGSLQAGGS